MYVLLPRVFVCDLQAVSKKFTCVGGLFGLTTNRVFQTCRVPSFERVTSERNIGSQETDVIG